jgi:hypothetical protein
MNLMKLMETPMINPFRPGAGHLPPYLAGRQDETKGFLRLLEQQPVLTNLVLTGLRGVGKTVLLETFKPAALTNGWIWVGGDASESASVSEQSLAMRILTDLAPVSANYEARKAELRRIGFQIKAERVPVRMDFDFLSHAYNREPGLTTDKLKAALEAAWTVLAANKCKGLVLAYDEAQNLADHAAEDQYPLSLLLDVAQSLQKKQLPFLLVLAGLPTLYPKLVEARTFAERMFHISTLGRLEEKECREAILRPVHHVKSFVRFSNAAVKEIILRSGGYPYFIQFLCREMFDAYMGQPGGGEINPILTVAQAVRKLDANFFSGRYTRASDRQQELLRVVARAPHSDQEFSVQQIVEGSRHGLSKPFSPSQVNQILTRLIECSLVYKNRHGRYSFAVPMLGEFIRRLEAERS